MDAASEVELFLDVCNYFESSRLSARYSCFDWQMAFLWLAALEMTDFRTSQVAEKLMLLTDQRFSITRSRFSGQAHHKQSCCSYEMYKSLRWHERA
jgi:hypothetical protein